MSSSISPPDSLLARLREEGIELVRVVGPSDRDDLCLDWVGAVLSVSGRTSGVPSLAQALRDGLLHPGCRHTLVAFNPRTVSPKRLEDAKRCTEHAMAAMAARAKGKEPPFLESRYQLQRDAARRAAQASESNGFVPPKSKFQRVYEAARKADAAGDTATALLKCRAALELLREHDLFGAAQSRLIQTLEERIAKGG